MLKKEPPSWSETQTKSIQQIKAKVTQLPPLEIPSDGIRILQTDASDQFWGAILFEKKGDKTSICGYKSGKFKDSETHYHSTFKEILAVKYGIEKFQFHLIGHRFIIQTDLKAFPRMLNFKAKKIPHPQLLRLQEWFSQFDFHVEHIPGQKNFLADFLSRPRNPDIPVIAMVNPFPTHPPVYPPTWTPDHLHSARKDELLKQSLLFHQSQTIQHEGFCLYGLPVHHDYPFYTLFEWLPNQNFPPDLYYFLWYLLEKYSFGISFPILPLFSWFRSLHPADSPLRLFLTQFKSFPQWVEILESLLPRKMVLKNISHVIIIFSRTNFLVTERHAKVHNLHVYAVLPYSLAQEWESHPVDFREFQRKISELNAVIP